MEVTDLTKSVDIKALSDARNAKLGALRDIAQTAKRINVEVYFDSYGEQRFSRFDDIRRSVDAKYWRDVMDRSGLWSFMNAKRREEWNNITLGSQRRRNGDSPEVPEFEPDVIAATFAALYDQRGAMLADGIVDLFKRLSWDYKTNQPVKIGKRIVMRLGGFASYGFNELDDADRVFHILDGKPEPEHPNGLGSRCNQACGWAPKRYELENEYMHVRAFKNRNGHVTFKRPDLVRQANLMIAKRFPGCLPEARQAA